MYTQTGTDNKRNVKVISFEDRMVLSSCGGNDIFSLFLNFIRREEEKEEEKEGQTCCRETIFHCYHLLLYQFAFDLIFLLNKIRH